MSNNLDLLSIRTLNGLGYISSNDIEQIGDVIIDGDLTVKGDISGDNLSFSVAGDSGTGSITLGDTLTVAGGTNCSTSFSNNILTVNADATDTTALHSMV